MISGKSFFSDSWIHRVRLPDDVDITSVSISRVPKGLEKVSFQIGCMDIFSYEVDEVLSGVSLIPNNLPTSLAYYHLKHVCFIFDKSIKKVEMVEEELVDVQYSDEEVEFFDGEEIRIGRKVKKIPRKTGRIIEKIIGYEIDIPDVRYSFKERTVDTNYRSIPVWKKVELCPDDNTWVSQRKVKTLDWEDVTYITEKKKYFLENILTFGEGFGGLRYLP